MQIPTFKYHPDPVSTGSVVPSDAKCVCCRKRRGFIYSGPTYADEELDDCLCPWCIADGSAHAKFDAEFVDAAAVGNYGSWDKVPQSVVEEVSFRTPGFDGWQEGRWWTHCGDAAAFLGPAGWKELQKLGPEAIDGIRRELTPGRYEMDVETYLQALNRDHGPTAYVFRCRSCGRFGGYSDCH